MKSWESAYLCPLLLLLLLLLLRLLRLLLSPHDHFHVIVRQPHLLVPHDCFQLAPQLLLCDV